MQSGENRETVLIHNNFDCHYEIIESVMANIEFIIHTVLKCPIIYLLLKNSNRSLNYRSYKEYIREKYPEIVLLSNRDDLFFDYSIVCSLYPHFIHNTIKNSSRIFYICHETSEESVQYSNIYHLTPLCKNDRYFDCDILPYSECKTPANIPIYIIQGDFEKRSLDLLFTILRRYHAVESGDDVNRKYPFKIKILTNKKIMEKKYCFDQCVEVYYDLDFYHFHQAFLDAYCILPLTSIANTPYYYTSKITSSINYAKGYQLYTIIDEALQDIYHLNRAFVFKDENDICDIFEKSLRFFYTNCVQIDK
jgi:hypothetical protein